MYTALLKFIFLKICVGLTLNSHEQRLLNLLKKKRNSLHFQNISREKNSKIEVKFNSTEPLECRDSWQPYTPTLVTHSSSN